MWDERVAKKFTSYADTAYYAKKRTPKSIFNAFNISAESGPDLDLNVQALREIQFKPHTPVSSVLEDISTTVVGHRIDLPVIFSSVGGLNGVHRDGEIAIARAAKEAGTIYYVSGMTTTPIEDIMKEATGPVFQQIYFIGSRRAAQEMVERAIAAGVSGLVLIADWPAFPEPFSLTPAERGFLPTTVTFKNAVKFMPQLVTRPSWAIDFLLNGLNAPMAQYSKGPDGEPLPYYHASVLLSHETPDLGDIKWIREMWKGPLILKGVMRGDDARLAADAGVDGIVVSNHVSAQPGRRIPTIRALPEVVEAVGDRVDVLFDGGIRGGSDVVKALALGAKAVGIGQMQVQALMAAGEPGVKQMMGMLRVQIIEALRQLGVKSATEIDPTALVFPADWGRRSTSANCASASASERRPAEHSQAVAADAAKVADRLLAGPLRWLTPCEINRGGHFRAPVRSRIHCGGQVLRPGAGVPPCWSGDDGRPSRLANGPAASRPAGGAGSAASSGVGRCLPKADRGSLADRTAIRSRL